MDYALSLPSQRRLLVATIELYLTEEGGALTESARLQLSMIVGRFKAYAGTETRN